MDISVEALQEAISIRRQIDSLEKRLSLILTSSAPRPTGPPQAGRYFSPATRAKLAAAARARWARRRTTTKPARARQKGGLTPAGRRRLSQLMKARWAERTKGAKKKSAGGPGPAGRRRLSELMKARWAKKKRARTDTNTTGPKYRP